MQFTFALHHMLHSHFLHTEGFPIHIGRLNPKVQERLREQIKSRRPAPAGK